MNRVRIGQNVGILVKCYSGGNAESFDNALIEYVKIVSRINPSVIKNIEDYSINLNEISFNFWGVDQTYLGGYYTGSSWNTTYNRFDEIRFSNIARWTENFTPPTAPYA